MKRLIAIAIVAAAVFVSSAAAATAPPDPFRTNTPPSSRQIIRSQGIVFGCEVWLYRWGYITRCLALGRDRSKKSGPAA